MTYFRTSTAPTITNGNTLNVEATFTYSNNSTETLTVPIFITAGMTSADIDTALSNRGLTGQAVIDNAAAAAALLTSLQA